MRMVWVSPPLPPPPTPLLPIADAGAVLRESVA